jgi:hypothetical protein
MKSLQHVFIISLISLNSVYGQDEMLQRIDGENVEKTIYVMLSHDNLKYKLDPKVDEYDDLGFTMKEKEDLLFNSRAPKVKLVFGFYNPYRYQIIVGQETSEDPLNESTEEFLTSFTSFLSVVTIGTPIPFKESESDALKLTLGAAFSSMSTDTKSNADYIASADAIVWLMWAQQFQVCKDMMDAEGQRVSVAGTRSDPDFAKKIESIIKEITNVEEILFNKFRANGEEEIVGHHFLKISQKLYASTIAKDFQKDVNDARTYFSSLKAKIEEIDEALKNLNGIKEQVVFKSPFCKNFEAYTIRFLNQYIKDMREKYTQINMMATKLDEFIKKGETYIDDNYIRDQNGVYKNISYNEDIYADYKTIRTVSLTLKKFEIVSSLEDIEAEGFLKTKTESKRNFKVVRFRRTWSEASAGLFYSNIEYLQYSTEEVGGALVVAEPTEKTTRALVGLFYNQIFNLKTYPLFPLFQLGVASGRSYPTILAGGGVRIISKDSRRFSITGGVALSFIQDLDKLSVGSTVKGQAEIDEDIKYKLTDKPGFYLGLAWKF